MKRARKLQDIVRTFLNLPYSDSEEEQEEGADLALQVVADIEELASPTPKEQGEPTKKASSRNPKTQRINKLLRKVCEMDILEREIKKNNATLTSRNKLPHKYYLE